MEILYLVLIILAGIFAIQFIVPVLLVAGVIYIITRLIFKGGNILGRRTYDSFNPFEANREDPEYRNDPGFGNRDYTYFEETSDGMSHMGSSGIGSADESYEGTTKPHEDNPFDDVPLSVTDEDFFEKSHEVIDAPIEEEN